jgi:hypothetical protein
MCYVFTMLIYPSECTTLICADLLKSDKKTVNDLAHYALLDYTYSAFTIDLHAHEQTIGQGKTTT